MKGNVFQHRMKTSVLASFALVLCITTVLLSGNWDRAAPAKVANDSIRAHVREGFSGSVMIASDDTGLIVNEGYRYTDSMRAHPIDRHTLFHIASITKTFTAVLIMKLVEKGRIGLEDSLGTVLSGVPPDKHGIIVHQLLTHTSGFQQHYVNEEVNTYDTALVRLFMDSLKFAPGSDFLYSNEN